MILWKRLIVLLWPNLFLSINVCWLIIIIASRDPWRVLIMNSIAVSVMKIFGRQSYFLIGRSNICILLLDLSVQWGGREREREIGHSCWIFYVLYTIWFYYLFFHFEEIRCVQPSKLLCPNFNKKSRVNPAEKIIDLAEYQFVLIDKIFKYLTKLKGLFTHLAKL